MIYKNVTLSSKHNYVWFRNPKVALTTVLNHLHKHTEVNYCTSSGRQNIYKKEKTYSIKDIFKFVFVRNPWDRLVSMYFDKNKNNSFLKPKNITTFEEFILFLTKINISKCNPHYVLQTTRFSISDMDFVGRFENFNEDFDFVCEEINIPKNNLHRNKSEHESYESYYNSKTRSLVDKIYQRDIQILDYKFGG